MALKQFKPTPYSRRYYTVEDFTELAKKRPETSLTEKKNRSGGRNVNGRKTARHRGGGHKRLYRIIDFRRDKDGIAAKVAALEYDPNRSARIALLNYADGEKRYILAPIGLAVGASVLSGSGADILPGNALALSEIPLGTVIHNIEMQPGRGAQMVRSAGGAAQLMAREGTMASVRLPSGEVRKVPAACRATIGQVGNQEHENISIGKAGRNRWKGIRPQSRGVAMNPIDHPHGGGEGKTSGGGGKGHHPRTPWGKPTLGYKTRDKKKPSNKYIVTPRPRSKKQSGG